MEKIWLKSYQQGISPEINADSYPSVVAWLQESCQQYGHKPALSSVGTTLSYAQLEEKSLHFAAFLQQGLGLQKGDRLAIMMPNLLQYPVVLYGALRAGLVIVNVNPFYTPPELAHQLDDAGAIAIVVLKNFLPTVAKVRRQLVLKHIIFTRFADLMPFPKAQAVNFAVKYLKNLGGTISVPGMIPFKIALRQGRKMTFTPVALTGQDLAFLQYTGGTTGVAKGVMLTHHNIVANLLQTFAWIKASLNIGEEIIIAPLPFYHAFALLVNCLLFLTFGAFIILISDPRDINSFVKELKKTPFTGIIGVGTLFKKLLAAPAFAKLEFKSLKFALGGGMALEEQMVKQWETLTNAPMIQGYGLTEASPVVAVEPMDRKLSTGSIGLPLPATDIIIVDDAGNELILGEAGELCVKGAQVMQGYWQNTTETQQVLSDDGWLHTGDIARLDDKGYIYLLDRKKDLIIVSGFNVYPSEVEAVINAHPDVVAAAVIGVVSEQSAEQVKAFVVTENSQLTAAQIIAYCRDHLTAYKVPKEIAFVDDLPTSIIGKVLRRTLREG